MKRMKFITVIAAALIAFCTSQSQAQFRIGPRVGLNFNELHFNHKDFSSSNRTGFNLGVMAEFTVPILGIGADASAMYVRRGAKWSEDGDVSRGGRDYIEFPINLKWRINIPAVNRLIRPYLTTGPSFAILTSSRHNGEYTNSKYDNAWNFGFGIEFIQRLQIGASYGVGMSKALKGEDGLCGHNRCWTVSAAYMFGL